MLALRVAVYGEEPDYTTEDDISSVLWNFESPTCVACQIAVSSFGNLQLVRRKSIVATVHIGSGASDTAKAALPLLDDCMTWEMTTLALEEARRTLNIDPSTFDFTALFLPHKANCSFAGRATVGCDTPPCVTWYVLLSHSLPHASRFPFVSSLPVSDPQRQSSQCGQVRGHGHLSLIWIAAPTSESLLTCIQLSWHMLGTARPLHASTSTQARPHHSLYNARMLVFAVRFGKVETFCMSLTTSFVIAICKGTAC
jgi:hypothetical protein